MSELALETVSVYAIKGDRHPDVWTSSWALLNGQRVAGGEIPSGYTQVDAAAYAEAVGKQERLADRRLLLAELEQRRELAVRRKALMESGLTQDQARILLPDPNDDYSIDDA